MSLALSGLTAFFVLQQDDIRIVVDRMPDMSRDDLLSSFTVWPISRLRKFGERKLALGSVNDPTFRRCIRDHRMARRNQYLLHIASTCAFRVDP